MVIKRSRSKKVATEEQELLPIIRRIKAEHPCWGYRRVWAYMKYREKLFVNKKRIYRIMKENKLLVPSTRHLKASRVERNKPRAERVNEYWGIDMTKIMVQNYGWVYLVIILDWYSKKIVGHSLSLRSTSQDWMEALGKGINNQFSDGIKESAEQLNLVSDNGSQPTSERFIKECSELRITQIFASYNNPKGNADTERVIRTLKEDLVWLREWNTVEELRCAIDNWIENYNTDYPHSSLNYMTPVEFETSFFEMRLFEKNNFNLKNLNQNLLIENLC